MSVPNDNATPIDTVVLACQKDNNTETDDEQEDIIGDVEACCILEFYRSANIGKYGTEDSYDGSFGFDRYDSSVCADGDIQHYKVLENVIPNRNTVSGITDKKKYLCPYLSIKKDKEITIYYRLEKSNRYDELKKEQEKAGNKVALSKATIKFVSTDSNLEITGAEIACTLFDDKPKSLTITCTGDIEQEVSIKAILLKVDGKDIIETLIGELIVIPNNKNYNAIVQPVFVYPKHETSFPKQLELDMTKLEEVLKERVFSQALIDIELKAPYQLPIQTKKEGDTEAAISKYITGDQLVYAERVSFNRFIESIYNNDVAATTAKNGSETGKHENESALHLRDTKLISKTKKYLEKLKKELKYNNKDSLIETLKYFNTRGVSLANAKALNQKAEFDLAKTEYIKHPSVQHLSVLKPDQEKKNHIQVFIHSFIKNAPNAEKANAAAYSGIGTGKCHIFTDVIKASEYEAIDHELASRLIAHEIGHSLGLRHTFKDSGHDPEAYEYRDSDIESKDDLEKKLRSINKDIGDAKTNIGKIEEREKKENGKRREIDKEREKRAKKAMATAKPINITDDDYAKLSLLDYRIKEKLIKKLEEQIETVKQYENSQPVTKLVMTLLNNVQSIVDESTNLSTTESHYVQDTIYNWLQTDTGLAPIEIESPDDYSKAKTRKKLNAEIKEKENDKKQVEQKIIDHKDERIEVKKLSMVVAQGSTKDNLMDYSHTKGGDKVSNFQYKTLRKWQWDTIIQIPYSNFNFHFRKNKQTP